LGKPVQAVDPDGNIAKHIPIDSVIGSVVYPASEVIRPGVIKVIEGNRFTLGEIDGSDTPSIRAISDAFKAAGFKAPVSNDIRSEIWLKVWGNLSFNPISALTHATLEDICVFPATRELAANMMTEAQNIGAKLGVQFKVSLEKRIAGAQAVGQHKTSMLQDVEAGRQLELQALVGAVIELGPNHRHANPYHQSRLCLDQLAGEKLGRPQSHTQHFIIHTNYFLTLPAYHHDTLHHPIGHDRHPRQGHARRGSHHWPISHTLELRRHASLDQQHHANPERHGHWPW
jgi:2-dehydropantoate 2-reductase